MVATPVVTESAVPSTESAGTHSPIARFDGTGSAMRFRGAVGADYIGAEGGSVYVWGQGLIAQLVIPAGALSGPTLLVVRIDADKRISVSSGGRDNEADFLKPVRLYFNPKIAGESHGGSKLMAGGSTTTTSFGTLTTKASGTGEVYNDPNNPPPGDGWVWVETATFTGWIILD
jgi:hypothetical protein